MARQNPIEKAVREQMRDAERRLDEARHEIELLSELLSPKAETPKRTRGKKVIAGKPAPFDATESGQ